MQIMKSLSEIKKGCELPEFHKTLSQTEILEYAIASGDFNRIHIDGEYARRVDFKGTIAHGMLLLGFVESMHRRYFGDLWSSGGSLDVKFKRPVHPGDIINIKSLVSSVNIGPNDVTIFCDVKADNGCDTILTGIAKLNIKREDSPSN